MTKLVSIATAESKDPVAKYKTPHGDVVECELSFHVKRRIVERFNKLTGIVLTNPEQSIVNLFNSSNRIGKKGKYKTRNKKHGGDTIYFQNMDLVFVVQNKVIKTVEIVTDRELNKC